MKLYSIFARIAVKKAVIWIIFVVMQLRLYDARSRISMVSDIAPSINGASCLSKK